MRLNIKKNAYREENREAGEYRKERKAKMERERGGKERGRAESMGVPFKVKIESRLRALWLRQFSKNIARRRHNSAVVKSAYSGIEKSWVL